MKGSRRGVSFGPGHTVRPHAGHLATMRGVRSPLLNYRRQHTRRERALLPAAGPQYAAPAAASAARAVTPKACLSHRTRSSRAPLACPAPAPPRAPLSGQPHPSGRLPFGPRQPHRKGDPPDAVHPRRHGAAGRQARARQQAACVPRWRARAAREGRALLRLPLLQRPPPPERHRRARSRARRRRWRRRGHGRGRGGRWDGRASGARVLDRQQLEQNQMCAAAAARRHAGAPALPRVGAAPRAFLGPPRATRSARRRQASGRGWVLRPRPP
jgi:hypothetical protein